jgi:hypothetical protein
MKENKPQPDSDIQQAANELKELIRSHYPHATFALSRGEDPDGYYLETVVDLDDPDEVMDLVVDRLLELQVDQGVPLHVLPLRTPARRQKLIRAQATTRPWNRDRSSLGL